MKVSFNVTGWVEYEVEDEEDKEKILELLNNGKITSFEDILRMDNVSDVKFNMETAEQVEKKSKSKYPVIEVHYSNDEKDLFPESIDLFNKNIHLEEIV